MNFQSRNANNPLECVPLLNHELQNHHGDGGAFQMSHNDSFRPADSVSSSFRPADSVSSSFRPADSVSSVSRGAQQLGGNDPFTLMHQAQQAQMFAGMY